MNNEDLQKLKAAAKGCDGWTWPDRRRDENGTHHFGKRTEDGEFHDMGTIDAWVYTSDYADDLRVLKFIRQAQPQTILALIAEVEQARAAKQAPVLIQHKRPIVNSQGECIDYCDWKDGRGLDHWPHRSLFAAPQ